MTLQANNYPFCVSTHLKESLISRARNDQLAEFLESGCDYLFTIDDDIELPEGGILSLISRDRDIVCGFYRIKRNDLVWAQRVVEVGGELTEDYRFMFAKKLCLPIVYGSSGCMLIKRETVLEMIKRYPDLKYRQNISGRLQYALYMPFIYKEEYLSEDWAFCQRAKDIGFTIYGDGAVRCDHHGVTKYSTSLSEEGVGNASQPQQERVEESS